MKRKKGTAHSQRYPLSIQDVINDVLDLVPSHSHNSSTRYSPTYGGLVRSQHYVERATPLDDAVCRGYINPNAPAKVPRDRKTQRTPYLRSARNTHLTGD